ncbi:helix-turn-helix domain-containing protein [Kineosporia babensis]|uniref:Helix-turn-helix domain-containing protein n=1 Tax=Kineosporia babensis TaxID=499548 RepID=A0A9X1N9I4_9ACTN|nr:helix-turn-helix transcriptional regulator [Kineosporia babensis]MCD5311042.1 helix-turn-helix domain-containing protein [Kineosporia babensis]
MPRSTFERGKSNTTFVGRRIGAQLKRLREEAGVDMPDLDRSGFMSRQTLWRLESGQGPYSEVKVRALCGRYGAEPDQMYKLLEMTERWRENSFHEPYGTRFGLYLETEQEAREIVAVHETVINGLLQTRDYHRGLCELIPPLTNADREIELRAQRQSLFFERDDASLTVVMDESALTQRVGSSSVMAEQIRHLRRIASLPNVDIRFIPSNKAHQAMIYGAFTLMKIDDTETVIYMESFNGSNWVSDARIVERYKRVADSIIAAGTTDIREGTA